MFEIKGPMRYQVHFGNIRWDRGVLTGDPVLIESAEQAYDSYRGRNVYDPSIPTAHLDHRMDEYCSWHILCSLFSNFKLVAGKGPKPPYRPEDFKSDAEFAIS